MVLACFCHCSRFLLVTLGADMNEHIIGYMYPTLERHVTHHPVSPHIITTCSLSIVRRTSSLKAHIGSCIRDCYVYH